MATARISFASPLGNPANFFVAALYDQGVLLESIQVPKGGGYPVPPATFQVSFTTVLVDGKTYRSILWESADATPAGQSRVSGDFAASTNSVALRGDLYLTGGGTPGMNVGAAGYVDPTSSLAGWGYSLEQLGFGTLKLGRDYSLDPVTNDWTLINGQTIGDQQDFVIHFQAQISAAAAPPVSAIQSGQIISIDTILTNAQKNKALLLQGAGTNLSLTLPALGTLADYADMMVFYSSGGVHITATIDTAGTDKILFAGQLVTELCLIQGEQLKLFKANGIWNIDYVSPTIYMVGEVVYKYSNNDVGLIFGNGVLKGRKDYQRLYNYASSKGLFVSESTWNTNVVTLDGVTYHKSQGLYTAGLDSGNFRLPFLIGNFIRNADGVTRTVGSLETDAIISHQHDTMVGLIPLAPNGFGPIKSGGKYGDPRTGNTDLTSPPYRVTAGNTAGSLLQRVATEVRPVNTGLFACIRY